LSLKTIKTIPEPIVFIVQSMVFQGNRFIKVGEIFNTATVTECALNFSISSTEIYFGLKSVAGIKIKTDGSGLGNQSN